MRPYPKLQTLYNRDPRTFKVTVGDYRRPEYAAIERWVVQEKIDGTNIRLHFERDHIPVIAGRTDKAQIPAHLLEVLQRLVADIEPEVANILDQYDIDSYTLFGEGYGAKIQKGGGNYRSDAGFILFDVLVNDRTWLGTHDVEDAGHRLSVQTVPVIGYAWVDDIVGVVNGGFPSTVAESPGFIAEGIVARPVVPLYDSRGERVMFKLKTKDFQGGKY